MKIYQIHKNMSRRTEKNVLLAEVSGLKKAAGGEDIIIRTGEAINNFNVDNFAKNHEYELKKLALRHINDYNPEFDNLENDPEFMMAEKLVFLAELVIRVTFSEKKRNIYGGVTDFVIEQLTAGNTIAPRTAHRKH